MRESRDPGRRGSTPLSEVAPDPYVSRLMRAPSHRLGALGLGLLLQVFVFAGFLHPCCLGEAEGMAHAGMHAEGAGGAHAAGESHGSAPDRHQDCAGCEGMCGLCGQRPGVALAPSGIHAAHGAASGDAFGVPAPPAPAPLLPAPAFLLPFANGPPLSPVANG